MDRQIHGTKVSALLALKAELEKKDEAIMTDKTATMQVYRIYIKAKPQAIWDAITKPEWTERYAYGGRVSLRVEGRRRLSPRGQPRDEVVRACPTRSSSAKS